MKRWFAFSAVGALGIVVQIVMLWMLSSGFGMNYLLATALAVEASVLHNFVWHQHWTWADRACNGFWFRRLALFHFINGFLSIGGNVLLVSLLVRRLHLNYVSADLLAIAACSLLTFLSGDKFVFRHNVLEASNELKNADIP